jgi:hypothetical protein
MSDDTLALADTIINGCSALFSLITAIIAGFIAYYANKISKSSNLLTVMQTRPIIEGVRSVRPTHIRFQLKNSGGAIAIIASFFLKTDAAGNQHTQDLTGTSLLNELIDEILPFLPDASAAHIDAAADAATNAVAVKLAVKTAMKADNNAKNTSRLATIGRVQSVFNIPIAVFGGVANFTDTEMAAVKTFLDTAILIIVTEELAVNGGSDHVVIGIPLTGLVATRVPHDPTAQEWIDLDQIVKNEFP